VAETRLLPAAPFGVPSSGLFGRTDGEPGVRVRLFDGLSICLIQPFAGRRADCAAPLKATLGLDLPDSGMARTAGSTTLAWAGPNALLAISATQGQATAIEAALGNAAAVIDQSGGRVVFRISGQKARAVLEKGVTIDLHPRSFRPGCVALTQLSHLSVQIVQQDETPTFDVVISRAFAADLWHWLEESAGEYGLHLLDDRN
jgi:heterotetrameric sarcosine oxidase gamma subunit